MNINFILFKFNVICLITDFVIIYFDFCKYIAWTTRKYKYVVQSGMKMFIAVWKTWIYSAQIWNRKFRTCSCLNLDFNVKTVDISIIYSLLSLESLLIYCCTLMDFYPFIPSFLFYEICSYNFLQFAVSPGKLPRILRGTNTIWRSLLQRNRFSEQLQESLVLPSLSLNLKLWKSYIVK